MEEMLDGWVRVSHNRHGVTNYKDRFIGAGQFIYEMLKPEEYFVFCTVRNPYNRFLSGLKYFKHTSKLPTTVQFWNKNKDRMRFWVHEHVMATQCEILGELVPDYVMHLETIEDDFKLLRARFGIKKPMPKLNSYSEGDLNEYQIKYVNKNFAEDFERFGYECR